VAPLFLPILINQAKFLINASGGVRL
jgi:hypothetical protein